jgi:hypothetical protein
MSKLSKKSLCTTPKCAHMGTFWAFWAYGHKVMFIALPGPVFREFIFKTNLMRNQRKYFSNLK